MNMFVHSRGGIKSLRQVRTTISHYKRKLLKFQQQAQFSLFNTEQRKVAENDVTSSSGNTGFIQLYHDLVKTNKIEQDPFQYKLVLILQALENNLNGFYDNVEKKLARGKTPRKKFFSSLFGMKKNAQGKGNAGSNKLADDAENGQEVEDEQSLENYQNDDNFFIYEEGTNTKEKEKRLHYDSIESEDYYLQGRDSLIEGENIKYIRGLYVYGSVGRGKTYFLNLLFDRIKLGKLKIHYHNFMQEVHKSFHEEKMNNSEDAIKSISIKMSKKYKLIFIDEFQVVHITDAMVINSLFKHLFYQGTVLLCSSNRNPKYLYHNGLNRERFIPFIKLLYKFNYIFEIDNYHDFRLRNNNVDNHIYSIPTKKFEEIKKMCNDMYCQVNKKDISHVRQVEKYNKEIAVSEFKTCVIPYSLNNYAIFSFHDICGQNISIDEFNAISKDSHTLFIYDIEKMNEETKGNEMRRFILLIDILYEKNTKVFFFSDVPIFQIFQIPSIISHFHTFIERMKKKYNNFNSFKNDASVYLKSGSFNREIFTKIVSHFDMDQEIGIKLFDAINFNINKEYIPIEYLRNVLTFHITNYEIDVKKHLKYLEDKDVQLEPIPYSLFDENEIDTNQENAFASMRTLSRMKHMGTVSYLEKHKKIYESSA
ncbi:Nucleotide binding protein [Plasmodium coatneyi]|uniref:Nucleotide binding protein n=1 Tax=Plasmodium coatneyi TaxID=208452 RepID=A0A1B1E153_9APIC|nr:Nucleotide binding protein [Plasmodium coatneyi]ANQ08758.1 Nucleotide binding protein [Plasmodium coatneyi]